jgi:hypothetical protein
MGTARDAMVRALTGLIHTAAEESALAAMGKEKGFYSQGVEVGSRGLDADLQPCQRHDSGAWGGDMRERGTRRYPVGLALLCESGLGAGWWAWPVRFKFKFFFPFLEHVNCQNNPSHLPIFTKCCGVAE